MRAFRATRWWREPVKKVHDLVKTSARPDLPLIFSEYNASYMNEVQVTDSPFMGPWLANTIRQCDGLVDMHAYWAFSDVFEEMGVVKRPFYGGYGLMAAGNIPKASFNAFKLLHHLGGERLDVESGSALATRRAESNGHCALVMELVEGPTLAERIARGVGPGFSPARAT